MTTNSKYIIDAYAWVEYILGTSKGADVRKIISNNANVIFTLESTFCEVKDWCLREGYYFNIVFPKMRQDTLEVPISLENWIRAAEIKFEQRKSKKDFGLLDALLLAYQEQSNGIIVTGDPHFKGLKKVKYIGP